MTAVVHDLCIAQAAGDPREMAKTAHAPLQQGRAYAELNEVDDGRALVAPGAEEDVAARFGVNDAVHG